MSTDDYLVDPLRDFEIRDHAKRLRRFLGIDDVERIDPLLLETVTEIWTVHGKKPFKLEAISDTVMPDNSGLTSYDGSRIVVQIPRRIRHKAFLGDGYARYTIAHELGHATLHLNRLVQGAALPDVGPEIRHQRGSRNSSRPNIRPASSAQDFSSTTTRLGGYPHPRKCRCRLV